MNNTSTFETKISDIKPHTNPNFSSCRIEVMYTGLNRNKSIISKKVVDNAEPTVYGIPIVGEFKEEISDFGGHGGKIEISDSGVKFIKTTVPYGFVPQDANTSWETIDGKEWFVIDGAILWTGRYEEALTVIEQGKGQSMEVEFISGKFNKDKHFEVEEMVFNALCILGDDKEPCFEGSNITGIVDDDESTEETFSYHGLDTDKFKAQFSLMVEELKSSLKGETNVNKENETPVQADFTFTSEQLENELRRLLRTQTYTDRWGWESNKFWFVDYTMDTNIVIAESNESNYLVGMDFTVNGDLVEINFDSARRFKVEFVEMALSSDPDGDGDNDIIDGDLGFSLMTPEKQEYLEKVAQFEAQQAEGAEGENTDKTFEAEGDGEGNEPVTEGGEGNFEAEVEGEPTPEVDAEFEALQAELEELRAFKAQAIVTEKQAKIDALFAQFSQLTEEDTSELRVNALLMEFEAVENALYAIVGRKMAQFSLNAETPAGSNQAGKMAVFNDNEMPSSDKSYASLIYKHTKGRR